MSQSAPQPNPLESDSDQSLSPKLMSEEEVTREVIMLQIFILPQVSFINNRKRNFS